MTRKMLLPIIFILFSVLVDFGTPCCEQKERIATYLETAMEFISKVKSENISCPEKKDDFLEKKDDCPEEKALDCADLYVRGYNNSGVYVIWPVSRLTSMKSMDVYCDMITDGGGWTVIQRRGGFGSPDDFFNQNWASYREGFGDLEKDFWLGNDNIFSLTNQRPYSVRFDLEDQQQKEGYAHYDNFWIDDEYNKYTLHISGYRGTAGDSMHLHNNIKFSTKDQNNNNNDINCGLKHASGWWFRRCYDVNLNGIYSNKTNGMYWIRFSNNGFLPRAEIKIRPSFF